MDGSLDLVPNRGKNPNLFKDRHLSTSSVSQSLKYDDLLSPIAIDQTSPFVTRHQDRYQDLLGERKKGQEVIQPHLDTNLSVEPQLPFPSEGMIISLELPQPMLVRTITTPGSHRSFRTAETTIHKPNLPRSGETSIRSLPILQPQPIGTIPRTIKSHPEPGRTSPIATKLASNPFVAKRRNPLAINLKRNKTFVTKRRPLLGLKRLHLNVGRRLTKNPLARAQYRKRRLSQGLSVRTPAAIPERKVRHIRRKKPNDQETGARQKRSMKLLGLRRKRVSRAERQEASQIVQQPQNKVPIADRRKLPRLMLSGRRSKHQSQSSGQQREAASKVGQNRKQKRIKRKMMGITLPNLRRKTRETAPGVTVLTVSAPLTPDPVSHARIQETPKTQIEDRLPSTRVESGIRLRIPIEGDRQPKIRVEDDRQHQFRERQRPSRERQLVQETEGERQRSQRAPRQREKQQQSTREDPQPRLRGHERNADRQLQERAQDVRLPREPQQVPREGQRSRPSLEVSVDNRQRQQERQSRERQIREPIDQERIHRQRAWRNQQQQSSEVEMQPRIRRQRTSDQSQRDRQLNYRAAVPQSPYTTLAPPTRMRYLNEPQLQSQSQNQAERIQFLPRAPQREAGSDPRERIRVSNRQPRPQAVEQDETRVQRKTRGQEQLRESSQRDSNTNNSQRRSERRPYRGVRA
ncbi:hypothetical protein SLS59_000467 [Nothophoma quercina]|uniref:Uncharacterized protein n=1 Tax=Nothophoma quercina TaxID=749835 RepID=A0ABR3S5H4_9PLEO